MRVPAAHILNQRDLRLCVLIGMAVGTTGAVNEGTDISVVFLSPTVDVLAAGFVADCSLCDTVLHGIVNYRLLIPHILCYLIHSE